MSYQLARLAALLLPAPCRTADEGCTRCDRDRSEAMVLISQAIAATNVAMAYQTRSSVLGQPSPYGGPLAASVLVEHMRCGAGSPYGERPSSSPSSPPATSTSFGRSSACRVARHGARQHDAMHDNRALLHSSLAEAELDEEIKRSQPM